MISSIYLSIDPSTLFIHYFIYLFRLFYIFAVINLILIFHQIIDMLIDSFIHFSSANEPFHASFIQFIYFNWSTDHFIYN